LTALVILSGEAAPIYRDRMNMAYQATLWRGMADEARSVAARLEDPILRWEMLGIAERYDRMAQRYEAFAEAQVANSTTVAIE
jgi:hypothetical protein